MYFGYFGYCMNIPIGNNNGFHFVDICLFSRSSASRVNQTPFHQAVLLVCAERTWFFFLASTRFVMRPNGSPSCTISPSVASFGTPRKCSTRDGLPACAASNFTCKHSDIVRKRQSDMVRKGQGCKQRLRNEPSAPSNFTCKHTRTRGREYTSAVVVVVVVVVVAGGGEEDFRLKTVTENGPKVPWPRIGHTETVQQNRTPMQIFPQERNQEQALLTCQEESVTAHERVLIKKKGPSI